MADDRNPLKRRLGYLQGVRGSRDERPATTGRRGSQEDRLAPADGPQEGHPEAGLSGAGGPEGGGPPRWRRVGEHTFVRRVHRESPLGFAGPRLSIEPGGPAVGRLLFFDTETTGLSGGAGNLVFLVGLGWHEEGDGEEGGNDEPGGGRPRLCVEQVFLSDYPGEPEFLSYLSRRLTEDRIYVSYNGKCFDAPLLKTRFLLNGMRIEMPDHLDLLHIARRFWKRVIGACALGDIEREVLGKPRSGDIPGFEIPDLYFDYLRTGRIDGMEGVFEHNLQDVLTLAGLLGHVERIVRPGACPAPVDLSSVGSFLLERGDQAGVEHLRAAFRRGDQRAGVILGAYYKRRKRWAEATAMWREMAGRNSVDAVIELAKYYEHRAADPQTALACLAELEAWRIRERGMEPELRRRRERLERKLRKRGRA